MKLYVEIYSASVKCLFCPILNTRTGVAMPSSRLGSSLLYPPSLDSLLWQPLLSPQQETLLILFSCPSSSVVFPEAQKWKWKTHCRCGDGTFQCHAILCLLLLLPSNLGHLVFVEVFINPLKYYLGTECGMPSAWLRARRQERLQFNYPAKMILPLDSRMS